MIIDYIKILVLLIPLAAIFSPKISTIINLLFVVLVPFTIKMEELGLPGMTRTLTYIVCLGFLAFNYSSIKLKDSLSILQPFLFLFFSLLILIPFESYTPYKWQLSSWRNMLMATLIFQFIFIGGALKDSRYLDYYKYTLTGATIVACVYGLFVFSIGGINPYISSLNISDWINEDWLQEEGRLFGRSQSTFSFPTTWGCYLSLAFSGFFIIALKEKKWYNWLVVALILINIFISGVRAAMVTMFLFLILYLLFSGKIKVVLYGVCILTISLFYIYLNYVDLFAYMTSVFDKSSSINGSSLDLRINQFYGCIDVMGDDVIVGKGYDFVGYYITTKRSHPVLHGFESSIYSILCESGFLGVFIWGAFYAGLFKLNRKILKYKNYILLDIFIVSYFVFTVLTGSFYFIQYFSLIYFFLLCYLNSLEKNEMYRRYLRAKVLFD